MATTKKSTTTKKKTPAKATTAKKAPARKTPVKMTTTRKSTASKAKTKYGFITKEQENFFSTRFTLQTVYWAIFAVAILALSLWILKMQMEILDLLQQVDTISSEAVTIPSSTNKS